ncbi:MAG: DNRLRE domain-containing protein [Myxococcales bacterium]|nr:DNRLRE domain-containing protein [Myxococcales bacterium]
MSFRLAGIAGGCGAGVALVAGLGGCNLVAGLNDYEVGTGSGASTASQSTSSSTGGGGGSGGGCGSPVVVPVDANADVKSLAPNQNGGGDQTFSVHLVGGASVVHALFRASGLSEAALGKNRAELCVQHASPAAGVGTGVVSAYELSQPWNEDEVTWNVAAGGVSWTLPGGDYEATPHDGVFINGQAQAETEKCWDVTAYAEKVAGASATDHGVILVPTGTNFTAVFFSDDATTVVRPVFKLWTCP